MSKSKGNVVDPHELIEEYGADTVRLFSLFAAPPEKDLEWSSQGVEGASRFLNRVYRFIVANKEILQSDSTPESESSALDRELHRKCHQTIKKVTQDIETNFHFNTAISAIMELFNSLSGATTATTQNKKDTLQPFIMKEAVETILVLLSPMVPHFTSEMMEKYGYISFLKNQTWPKFDEEAAKEEMLTIVLQVNGKVRSRLLVESDIDDDTLKEMAQADDNVNRFIASKIIKKIIVVKKKLVNIVI